jgi:hypothetical protein
MDAPIVTLAGGLGHPEGPDVLRSLPADAPPGGDR